jgi:CheY-like chemotaxis protein
MSSSEKTKRVLVADDDPIFLGLFDASLASSAFEVVPAGDGAEAMLSLESQPFDLAVIDVDMPIIDGVRLTALIRATPHLRDLPIMVITAMRDPRIKEECLQTGADDFMTKPVDWALLPMRLERMLVLRRAGDLVVPTVDAAASALPVSSAT